MTDTEEAIVRELYRSKAAFEHKTAYCTSLETLEYRKWNGTHPVDDNTEVGTWPTGMTLKIVMVSRFDDCGLTDDLDTLTGYHCRVSWDSGKIGNIRWTP